MLMMLDGPQLQYHVSLEGFELKGRAFSQWCKVMAQMWLEPDLILASEVQYSPCLFSGAPQIPMTLPTQWKLEIRPEGIRKQMAKHIVLGAF